MNNDKKYNLQVTLKHSTGTVDGTYQMTFDRILVAVEDIRELIQDPTSEFIYKITQINKG